MGTPVEPTVFSIMRERCGRSGENRTSCGKTGSEKETTEVLLCIGSYQTRQTEVYDPEDDVWFSVGKLNYERCFAAAAKWNGKAVVAGGFNPYKLHSQSWLNSVEVYDPETNRWALHSRMRQGRSSHLLVNHLGVLYAVGGDTEVERESENESGRIVQSRFCTVERFHEDKSEWHFIKPFTIARKSFAATSCSLGILVAGGETTSGGQVLSSCEMFDVHEQRWVAITPMRSARRAAAAATWSYFDVVYVLGGYDVLDRSLNDVEQYDPTSNRWTVLRPRMQMARGELTATCVDGRVYVVGGRCGRFPEHSVECFDPFSKRFYNFPPLSHLFAHTALTVTRVCLTKDALKRLRATAIAATYSRPLSQLAAATADNVAPEAKPTNEFIESEREMAICVGGNNTRESLVLDARRDVWVSFEQLSCERCFPAATTADDKVFVAGGYSPEEYDSEYPRSLVEQFDLKSKKWCFHSHLSRGRSGHALVNFKGVLYAIGGDTQKDPYRSVERYNSKTSKWELAPLLLSSRRGLAAAATSTVLMVIGGSDSGKHRVYSSCESFDDRDNRWSATAQLNTARCNAAAAAFKDSIFVFGGMGEGYCYLDDAEQFDSSVGVWTVLQSRLHYEREELAAACVGGRIYLAGGNSWRVSEDAVECFDPRTQSFSLVAPLIESFSKSKIALACVRLSPEALRRYANSTRDNQSSERVDVTNNSDESFLPDTVTNFFKQYF